MMRLPQKVIQRSDCLVVLMLSIAIAAWRFIPYTSSTFYGDDLYFYLSMIDGDYGARISDLFFLTYQERFRPIGFGYAELLFNLFGPTPIPHLAANLFLPGLSAVFVFVIVRRVSAGNWPLAFAMALAVASFRFATVSITQVIAAEALSLFFFMALVYSALRANECPRFSLSWGWLSILLGFLAVHTHERYIVVFVWLLAFFLLSPSARRLPRGNWFGLIAASLCAPMVNVFYKLYVLHTPFFVGTGGTHIKLDIMRVLWHLGQSGFSIFGFNVGPEYLTGVQITSLPWSFAWFFALFITVSCLFLFYGSFLSVTGVCCG